VTVATKGLLFDMDGVLISSIGSVIRCWRRWAELYDIPNAETFEVPHGMRALEIIHSLRPDVDAGEALRDIEDMEIEDTADLKVLPGVKPLLESLPPERWAIVTSSTRRLLLGRLRAAGLPIPERIVSADDVDRGKPDPLPYLCGAELLGLGPAECIVLEDAPAGVSAGMAAGCRVVGVLGTHEPQELNGATWFTPSLEHMTAISSGHGLELMFEALSFSGAPAETVRPA
jgi:sugar-phosphatase